MAKRTTKKITITSQAAMRKLGEDLGKRLSGTETIGLVGELGAGKTQLVKGLAVGFGVTGNVISPTFVLQRRYLSSDHKKVMNHFDVYRIDEVQLANLGILDWLGKMVNVVEWGDMAEGILPHDTIWIDIKTTSETERVVTITLDDEHAYLTKNFK